MKKTILRFWNRIRINTPSIFRTSRNWIGAAMTILCFLSLFFPFSEVIPSEYSYVCKILFACFALVFLVVLLTLASLIRALWSNKVCVINKSHHHVYVQYGDVFSPDVVEKGYSGKWNIVIPVNRCFDTVVDDNLVSLNSLHGKLFQRLYKEKSFTIERLNNAIQDSLVGEHYQELSQSKKPEGNLKRYDAGTIAELKLDKVSYYLLGLSFYNNNLVAQTSKADFVASVQKLIEFCGRRCQGYPVVLPLLGAGMANLNLEMPDILHYLVNAFEINKDRIRCDFHIVIWEGHKDLVSITNLKNLLLT